MLALLGWFAVSAGFAYVLHARHLAHYLLDAAICVGSVVWLVLGIGLVGVAVQRLTKRAAVGKFSPAEVDRMIAEQKRREAEAVGQR